MGKAKTKLLVQLAGLTTGPKLEITYQRDPTRTLHNIVPEFPKAVLAEYPGLFNNEILTHDLDFVTINGGEVNSHVAVLTWIIKSAIAVNSLTEFEDLKDFSAYVSAIDSMMQLQVLKLERVLSDKLEVFANKQQVDLDTVKEVYRTRPAGHILRRMVVVSIAKAIVSDETINIFFILDACDKFPEFDTDPARDIQRKRMANDSSLSSQEILYLKYKVFKENHVIGGESFDTSTSELGPPVNTANVISNRPSCEAAINSTTDLPPIIKGIVNRLEATAMFHFNDKSRSKEDSFGLIGSPALQVVLDGIEGTAIFHVIDKAKEEEEAFGGGGGGGGGGSWEIGSEDDDNLTGPKTEIGNEGEAKSKKRLNKFRESSRGKRRR